MTPVSRCSQPPAVLRLVQGTWVLSPHVIVLGNAKGATVGADLRAARRERRFGDAALALSNPLTDSQNGSGTSNSVQHSRFQGQHL